MTIFRKVWQPIATVPAHVEVELSIYDKGEYHALVFPRKSGCDMTVRHILQQKGRNLWTIAADATVFDALAKMAEKDIGSLVVMDREN